MPPFTLALFIHLISLIIGFGSVVVIDTFGLLWLLRRVSLSFIIRVASFTQPLIWVGWFGLVFSGLFLLRLKGIVDNLMWMKLYFVALIGLNGVWLHLIKKGLERIPDGGAIPPRWKFRMTLASVISQVGWWSAIAIGFLHHEWRGVIHWPPNPWLIMALILGVLAVTVAIGEMALRKK